MTLEQALEENRRLRAALEKLTLDVAGEGRSYKGNEQLPGCSDFYRGYNAGITSSFKHTSGIARAALTPAVSGEPSPEVDKHAIGLYNKFTVRRTDGKDMPGGKHDGCYYFVLDTTHDLHAKAALLAYAESCQSEYPLLAVDVRKLAGEPPQASEACAGVFGAPHRCEKATDLDFCRSCGAYLAASWTVHEDNCELMSGFRSQCPPSMVEWMKSKRRVKEEGGPAR